MYVWWDHRGIILFEFLNLNQIDTTNNSNVCNKI